jgi:hypothetical protein
MRTGEVHGCVWGVLCCVVHYVCEGSTWRLTSVRLQCRSMAVLVLAMVAFAVIR